MWTRIKRWMGRKILKLLYSDWTIGWNVESTKDSFIYIPKTRRSFIIENCKLLGFQDKAIKIEYGPEFGVVSNCYITRLGITKLVPKPKSYEHNVRRGMSWLFR